MNHTATPARRSNRAAVALGLTAALAVTACGSDDDSPEPAPTDGSRIDDSSDTSAGSDDGSTSDSDDAAVSEGNEPAPASDVDLTLVAYESFPSADTPINDRLADFTADTGIDVEILIAGDTGTMLSKAELTAGNPEGDVMWGIDNTFLSRAIASDVFEPYQSPGLSDVPAALTELVPNGEATPVDIGDVCINYDIAALEALELAPPMSLADLADPAYADLLVVENPASSSPGLAFLLATIDEYGADGWQDYWSSLVDNGVEVVDSWSQAYYEVFSYAGGERPLVVSYGSSPPFEVLFGDGLDTAPTGVVESTCYRQVEFAGILAGTEHPAEAQQLIDFLIGVEFQSELPLNVFVFPANSTVELDQTFQDFAVIPDDSRALDPAEIAANREDWIDDWTDLVLG